MSSTLDRPASARAASDPAGSPYSAAVLAALRAAAAGLVAVLVPVVVAWVLGAGGQVTWIQAVRFAISLWLLAHHAGLTIAGGHVGLVPLGFVAVPLLACRFAARRLARAADPKADRIDAGATRAAPARLPLRLLAAFVGTYCLLACLGSLVAAVSGLRPVSGQALLGSAVVALTGGAFGAAEYRCRGARGVLSAAADRLPRRSSAALRPAGVMLGVLVAASAALVVAMLLLRFGGVHALHRALRPGVAGGAVLTLGQLALLPNLVLWALAVLAGPGVAVGSGTSVTVVAGTLGPLPAIPVLAALPAPGPLPAIATALLAVPLLAGVAGGLLVLRDPDTSLLDRLERAASGAVLAALAVTAGTWASGGPAGPGRLADVGPQPLHVGAAVALELGIGSLVTVAVVAGVPALVERVRGMRADAGDGTDRAAGPDGDPEPGGR